MKERIRILAIPFLSREGEVERNVRDASRIIRDEMALVPADLVVLPELFTAGYCAPSLAPFAEPLDGPTRQAFAALSRDLDVLIGYGFAEATGQPRVYNSWALIEPDGTAHVYRKTHLHPTVEGDKVNEPDFLLPGQTLEPFRTRLGMIGVMICYDGCFVEVPRVLALKGADLILWPSRSGGYLAAQSLTPARSLDNMIDIVQVEGGQSGPYMPLKAWSVVGAPGGTVRASRKDDPAPFRVEVDVEAGRRMRASTDAGAHSLYRPRRPELYSVIAD